MTQNRIEPCPWCQQHIGIDADGGYLRPHRLVEKPKVSCYGSYLRPSAVDNHLYKGNADAQS